MSNDDGALFYLDDELVLENDGPQDSTSVMDVVELEEGVHDLRIEHYEGTNNQRLTLEWKEPGQEDFVVVPNDVLTTEAGVVRVTDPGIKNCVGDNDTAGDGLPLFDVNPNYDLVDLRPEGFEPMVSALDFTEDGDLVAVTSEIGRASCREGVEVSGGGGDGNEAAQEGASRARDVRCVERD